MRVTRALTRGISDDFDEATTQTPSGERIDVGLARRQHTAYVAALRACGVDVVELPPLAGFADGCFVEDCAIQAGGIALVTRPGAPSRRGEAPSVGAALGAWMPTVQTRPPATLDGGDCLRVGTTWFVGRSDRTNAEGAARVGEVFAPRGFRVVEVQVRDALHLKCVCARIDDERILVAHGALATDLFDGFEVVEIPATESYAANVVSVNGHVLVAAGFPETARIVASLRLPVVTLDVSEIRKADGSLTCLSILV